MKLISTVSLAIMLIFCITSNTWAAKQSPAKTLPLEPSKKAALKTKKPPTVRTRKTTPSRTKKADQGKKVKRTDFQAPKKIHPVGNETQPAGKTVSHSLEKRHAAPARHLARQRRLRTIQERSKIIRGTIRKNTTGEINTGRDDLLPDRLSRIRARIDHMRGRFRDGGPGERAPLPEGVDTGRFDQGPTRERPEAQPGYAELIGNDTPRQRYDRANAASDVSDNYRPGGSGGDDGTFLGTMNKVRSWGSDDGPQGEDGTQDPDDITPAGSDEDVTEDEPPMSAEEKNRRAENGEYLGDVDYDFSDDADPEGDDPDEIHSSTLERGLSRLNGEGAGTGEKGQWQFRTPRDRSKEEFQRQHHRRTRRTDIDPEDGGPDEISTHDEMAGLDNRLNSITASATGSAASPPDGGQDPDNPAPPRPEFTAAPNIAGLSDGWASTMQTGSVASPVDGGQDPDTPGPIGPQY